MQPNLHLPSLSDVKQEDRKYNKSITIYQYKKNGALMECHFFVRSLVKLVRAYPLSINPEYDSGITNGENK